MKPFSLVRFARVGTFVSIILVFIYNVVLDKQYKCNCNGRGHPCVSYMVMPSIMLFILQLWMIKKGSHNRKGWGPSEICCYMFKQFIKAVVVGLLWIVSLLIEGDWYVCCWYKDESDKDLACKDTKNLNSTEQVILNNRKSFSEHIAWGLIVVILIVVSIMRWSYCSEPDYSDLYEGLKSKETKHVLKEIAREDLKKELKLNCVEKRSDILVEAANTAVRAAGADEATAGGAIDGQITFLSGDEVVHYLTKVNEGYQAGVSQSANQEGGGQVQSTNDPAEHGIDRRTITQQQRGDI